MTRCAMLATGLALAALAVASSAFNLVGGFVVTGRMLRMFKKPAAEGRDSQSEFHGGGASGPSPGC